jgi:hypothetical protein
VSAAIRPQREGYEVHLRNGTLSGFLLIEGPDLKETIQVAAKIPMARRGSIEVRPIEERRP